MMKLVRLIRFKGEILCETGLCIKGSGTELSIGGADSEVIKNPLTGDPYIPGSSLKGKMRSQLEKRYGMKKIKKDRQNNKTTNQASEIIEKEEVMPCGCGQKNCPICVIFGAHKNVNAASAPTRIIVRDSNLSEQSKQEIERLPNERGNYLELKMENIIKRNLGTADAPRTIERVPAGSIFDLEIMLQVFDEDEHNNGNNDAVTKKDLVAYVEEALKLVELSYLGGSGSRGYGKVKFNYEKEEYDFESNKYIPYSTT